VSNITAGAEKVTGTNVGEAQTHAVEKADEHTPNPPEVRAVEHVPDPPKADDGLDALKDTVGELANAVANLTNLVTGQVTKDESPASVPWTHRGIGH